MSKIDPLDLPAFRQPRSFWGLCAHCVEDKRVRKRTLMDERVVNLCDKCFRDGAVVLDMNFSGLVPMVTLKGIEWESVY